MSAFLEWQPLTLATVMWQPFAVATLLPSLPATRIRGEPGNRCPIAKLPNCESGAFKKPWISQINPHPMSNFAGFFVRAQAKSLKESFVRTAGFRNKVPQTGSKQKKQYWHMKHEVSKTCLLKARCRCPRTIWTSKHWKPSSADIVCACCNIQENVFRAHLGFPTLSLCRTVCQNPCAYL